MEKGIWTLSTCISLGQKFYMNSLLFINTLKIKWGRGKEGDREWSRKNKVATTSVVQQQQAVLQCRLFEPALLRTSCLLSPKPVKVEYIQLFKFLLCWVDPMWRTLIHTSANLGQLLIYRSHVECSLIFLQTDCFILLFQMMKSWISKWKGWIVRYLIFFR